MQLDRVDDSFLSYEMIRLKPPMDFICDRILQQLESDRQREVVDVKMVFTSPPTPKDRFQMPHCDSKKLETEYRISFIPVFPCDFIDENFIVSISGISFRPNRDIIKTFVSSWVNNLADSASDDRIKCASEISAVAKSECIYQRTVKFDFCKQGNKNRRAINRLVESVMHVKGLCNGMA